MNENNLHSIDLNLLLTLDALLSEGSVTRASKRLGVGQPATSHALARLRRLFGDPLFVRSGRGMVATPRAESLREPLKRWLADAQRLLAQETGFDPQATTRSFVMISPDLVMPVLLGLLGELRALAPRARLEVYPRSREDVGALERGQADLALGIFPVEVSGLMTRGVGQIHWGVVMRCDHPLLEADALGVEELSCVPHILVRQGHGGRGIVSDALERAGVERSIGLVVPSFLAALMAAAHTDLCFLAPRELVRPMCGQLGLAIAEPPLELPPVPVMAFWHERYQEDPGHRFFRSLVMAQLREHFAPSAVGVAGEPAGASGPLR